MEAFEGACPCVEALAVDVASFPTAACCAKLRYGIGKAGRARGAHRIRSATAQAATEMHWNEHLFLLLNASATAPKDGVALARALAVFTIGIVPVVLAVLWLWGDAAGKKRALGAALSGLASLALAQLVAAVYFHPRPFMLHLGLQLLQHAPETSFPSDHVTLLSALGFSLLFAGESLVLGSSVLLLALAVGWARVYLGVHFPADVAGGFAVGLCASALIHGAARQQELVFRRVLGAYHLLFAPLISRGWLRG